MGGKINRNKLIQFAYVLPLAILAAILVSVFVGNGGVMAAGAQSSMDNYGIGISVDKSAIDIPSVAPMSGIATASQQISVVSEYGMGYRLSATASGLTSADGEVILAKGFADNYGIEAGPWGYRIGYGNNLWRGFVAGQSSIISQGDTSSDIINVEYGINPDWSIKPGKYQAKITYTATALHPDRPVVYDNSLACSTDDDASACRDIDVDAETIDLVGYNLNKNTITKIVIETNDVDKQGGLEQIDCPIVWQTDNNISCQLPHITKEGIFHINMKNANGVVVPTYKTIKYYYQPSIKSVKPDKLQIGKVAVSGVAENSMSNMTMMLGDNGVVYGRGKFKMGDESVWFDDMANFTVRNLGEKVIVDVAANGNSYYAIGKSGKLYVWGYDSVGQLGMTSSVIGKPIDYPMMNNFFGMTDHWAKSVSAGGGFAVVITDDGMFTFGSNDEFQIGQGNGNAGDSSYLPFDISKKSEQALKPDEKFVQASAGDDHAIALTNYNRLFSWGSHDEGQLGRETQSDAVSPHDVTTELGLQKDEHISKTAAGGNVSMVVTDKGRLLAWGDNQKHQIASSVNPHQLKPFDCTGQIALDEGDYIIGVDTNGQTILAWTKKGKLYIWGDNQGGLLLNENNVIVKPTAIDVTGRVDRARISNHEIYIVADGRTVVLKGGGIRNDLTSQLTNPVFLLDIAGHNLDKVRHVWADFNNNGIEDLGEAAVALQSNYSARLLAQLPTAQVGKTGSYDLYVRTSNSKDVVLPKSLYVVVDNNSPRLKVEDIVYRKAEPVLMSDNGQQNSIELTASSDGTTDKMKGVDKKADIKNDHEDVGATTDNGEANTAMNTNDAPDDKATEASGDKDKEPSSNVGFNKDVNECSSAAEGDTNVDGDNNIGENPDKIESTDGSNLAPPCNTGHQLPFEKSVQSIVQH